MKISTIAVSIAMAGIFAMSFSTISNGRVAHGLTFVETEYEPFNVCHHTDCSGIPGLTSGGSFENDQNLENEAKADQELEIKQEVKCEHVHTCSPQINVDKSLTTEDEREYETDQEYEGTHGEDYGETLEVTVKFDGDIDEYGDGKLSVNDITKKFNVEEEVEKHGNPLRINYYFIGYAPEESEVCVKNLETDEKNCEEVYAGQDEVTLKFPD